MLVALLKPEYVMLCFFLLMSFGYIFDIDMFPFLNRSSSLDSYCKKHHILSSEYLVGSFLYLVIFYILWCNWFIYALNYQKYYIDWGLYSGMPPLQVFGWYGYIKVFWYVDPQIYFQQINRMLDVVCLISFLLNVFFLKVLYNNIFLSVDRSVVYENLSKV